MADDPASKEAMQAEIDRLRALIPTNEDPAPPPKKKRGRPPGAKNKTPSAKAKPTTPTTSSKAKKAAAKPVKAESEENSLEGVPEVPWKTEPELSENLLTAIEDNEARRIALGFTKGDGANAGHQTGATKTDHVVRVIEKTLALDARWKDVEPKKLVGVVKGRLKRMRELTSATLKQFGETGAGLVESGQEDELDGYYSNLLEGVRDKHPWFLRMARLMRGSPVADTRFCSNSTTSLDDNLDAMVGRVQSDVDEIASQSDGPPPESQFDEDEAREVDEDPDADNEVVILPKSVSASPAPHKMPALPAVKPPTKPAVKPIIKPEAKTAASASRTGGAGGTKRKSVMDGLAGLLADDRETKRQALSARFQHEREMEQQRQAGEMAKLKFQAEEREREFQRQLKLAEMRGKLQAEEKAETFGGWEQPYNFSMD
ncbi:hypothetical protein MKEN_01302800 [Mycena kentingensis (nom. inval.)]|nr:hypothetical protein MKEN_01302800 [Mycena kentingensis (nom. inval.)]